MSAEHSHGAVPDHSLARVLDGDALIAWLMARSESNNEVRFAVYQGLIARVRRGDFNTTVPVEGIVLTVGEIQHLWIVLAWARQHGFDATSYDDKYLHAAEAKLQAAFDAQVEVER